MNILYKTRTQNKIICFPNSLFNIVECILERNHICAHIVPIDPLDEIICALMYDVYTKKKISIAIHSLHAEFYRLPIRFQELQLRIQVEFIFLIKKQNFRCTHSYNCCGFFFFDFDISSRCCLSQSHGSCRRSCSRCR